MHIKVRTYPGAKIAKEFFHFGLSIEAQIYVAGRVEYQGCMVWGGRPAPIIVHGKDPQQKSENG